MFLLFCDIVITSYSIHYTKLYEVLPVLEREIRKNMPWYYLRNIILLFGRMGDASHTDILQPFLDHEDDRVQREALTSIHEIGGDRREEVFLDAFSKSEEPFRRHVVRMLGQSYNFV